MAKAVNPQLWNLLPHPDGRQASYPYVAQQQGVGYRIVNNESGTFQQSNTNASGVETSAAARQDASYYDWLALQWKWQSAQAAELVYLNQMAALNPDQILIMYTDGRFSLDSAATSSDETTRALYLAMTTNGAPDDWKARNAAGQWLAHRWRPNDTLAANWCATSTNAQGDTLAVAWRKRVAEYFQLSRYKGWMFDDWNIRPNNLQVRSPNYGESVNWDYNRDGVDDNWQANGAFETAWLAGMRAGVDAVRAAYPDFAILVNHDIGFYYTSPYGPVPPMPFTSSPFYEMADVAAHENGASNQWGLGEGHDTTVWSDHVYRVRGWYNLEVMLASMELYKLHVRPDAQNVMGKRISCVHQSLRLNETDTPTETDYQMARLLWIMARLMPNQGYGAVRSGSRTFPLDEQCLEPGAVVGSQGLGSLAIKALSGVSYYGFNQRTPDATVGSAQFYWQEFTNLLAIARLDNTGLPAGSGILGQGTEAACALPNPGFNMRWRAVNSAVVGGDHHPTFANLRVQAQSPTINNGQVATQFFARPLTGQAFIRERIP